MHDEQTNDEQTNNEQTTEAADIPVDDAELDDVEGDGGDDEKDKDMGDETMGASIARSRSRSPEAEDVQIASLALRVSRPLHEELMNEVLIAGFEPQPEHEASAF